MLFMARVEESVPLVWLRLHRNCVDFKREWAIIVAHNFHHTTAWNVMYVPLSFVSGCGCGDFVFLHRKFKKTKTLFAACLTSCTGEPKSSLIVHDSLIFAAACTISRLDKRVCWVDIVGTAFCGSTEAQRDRKRIFLAQSTLLLRHPLLPFKVSSLWLLIDCIQKPNHDLFTCC